MSRDRFTPEEQQSIAEAIDRNKEEDRRVNDNYGIVLCVVWILTALLLAKTTELGLTASGILGLIAGWFVASRLK
ncbi:Uncharacterised protein [Serratia quinivorans]|nr:Uncharacterised protein [Serratia quinivorans]CAI2395318.1 Uncharacterised protein [Serratia quinivorans]